jgi:hypothetical protein
MLLLLSRERERELLLLSRERGERTGSIASK